MTGRTHDLAAFTALSVVLVHVPLPQISLATALVAFSANMIGGLAPDIDQPTADLWRKLPAGSIIGRIFSPFLGGHRTISHSLLGIVLFGFLARELLGMISGVLLVDMQIVWWAFMIGFVSHLLMDTLTTEGVPWLFPIPWHFGFPPLKSLRIKTGGVMEKGFIFPLLLFLTGYIYYHNYHFFLMFVRGLR